MATGNFTQYDESIIYAIEDDSEVDYNIFNNSLDNVTYAIMEYFESKKYIQSIKNNGNTDSFITIFIDDDNYVTLTLSSGYYSGANFGYKINIDDNITKTNKHKIDRVCRVVEKIYKDYTTPLQKVATFSNSETIYEKIIK